MVEDQLTREHIADNDGFDFAATDDAARNLSLLVAVKNKRSVIELGCGSGRNTKLLREYFKDITLVEQNPAAIQHAS